MTNSEDNPCTGLLLESLRLLKIKYIFYVHTVKFWYKFINNTVPTYFGFVFRYNQE